MLLPNFLTRHADGEIRLTGHRIGLYSVVRRHQEGHSAEQISEEFPSLPLALVRQVLAYYRDNQPEVDAYVAGYRAELERQEREHVPGPGALRIRQALERIEQADRQHEGDPAWLALGVVEKLRRIEQEDKAGAP